MSAVRVNEPSAPGTVTDYATSVIRDRIVLGILQPGEKLSVYSLAEELGISRVPLREAVRQLEAESLVDNVARRGTVIRPLSGADVRDAFAIFDRIEVIAVSRAAGAATDRIAQEMRHWFDQMETLRRAGVPHVSEEMLHAHRAFHFAMFRGGGEEGVLYRHLCMLWNTCERYVINSRTPERQDASRNEHAQILARIEDHDITGATQALRTHLQAAYRGTKAYLQQKGIEVPED